MLKTSVLSLSKKKLTSDTLIQFFGGKGLENSFEKICFRRRLQERINSFISFTSDSHFDDSLLYKIQATIQVNTVSLSKLYNSVNTISTNIAFSIVLLTSGTVSLMTLLLHLVCLLSSTPCFYSCTYLCFCC